MVTCSHTKEVVDQLKFVLFFFFTTFLLTPKSQVWPQDYILWPTPHNIFKRHFFLPPSSGSCSFPAKRSILTSSTSKCYIELFHRYVVDFFSINCWIYYLFIYSIFELIHGLLLLQNEENCRCASLSLWCVIHFPDFYTPFSIKSVTISLPFSHLCCLLLAYLLLFLSLFTLRSDFHAQLLPSMQHLTPFWIVAVIILPSSFLLRHPFPSNPQHRSAPKGRRLRQGQQPGLLFCFFFPWKRKGIDLVHSISHKERWNGTCNTPFIHLHPY